MGRCSGYGRRTSLASTGRCCPRTWRCWPACPTPASSAWPRSSPTGASTAAFPTTRRTLPRRWSGTSPPRSASGVDALDGYDWAGRTGRRHRRVILDHLAVAAFDEAAEAAFRRWLADELLPREPAPAALEEEIAGWFARERVTRPGAYRLDRILRSARAAHDDAALQRVADRLDAGTRERLGRAAGRRWRGHRVRPPCGRSRPGRAGEPAGRDRQAGAAARAGAAAGPVARPAPGPGQALPPARGGRDRLGAAPPS